MGMYLGGGGMAGGNKPETNLGVMSGTEVPAAPPAKAPEAASPASDVPQAAAPAPAPAATDVPAAPQPATPAVAPKADDKTEAKADESKKN